MSKDQRVKVSLACEVCGARNYRTTKPRSSTERLTLKKFCPACRVHTVHSEKR